MNVANSCDSLSVGVVKKEEDWERRRRKLNEAVARDSFTTTEQSTCPSRGRSGRIAHIPSPRGILCDVHSVEVGLKTPKEEEVMPLSK